MERKKVILITDGDSVAQRVVETVAPEVGVRCISFSGGNPSLLDSAALVDLIHQAASDTVLVMVDDNGDPGKGKGETLIKALAKEPSVEIIGAVAVASDNHRGHGIHVDYSVTREGEVIEGPVDKDGYPAVESRLHGDTVDTLESVDIPVVVGLGDPGKMKNADRISRLAPRTHKAIEMILQQYREKKGE